MTQNVRQIHKILEETLGTEPFEPELLAQLDCGKRDSDLLRLQCAWRSQLTEKLIDTASDLDRTKTLYEVTWFQSQSIVKLIFAVFADGTTAIELHSKQLRSDAIEHRRWLSCANFGRFHRGFSSFNISPRSVGHCNGISRDRSILYHDVRKQLCRRRAPLLVLDEHPAVMFPIYLPVCSCPTWHAFR